MGEQILNLMPKKQKPKQLDGVDALTAYIYADTLRRGDIKTLRDEVIRLTKLTEWQPIETAPKTPSVIENRVCERHSPMLLCIAGKECAEIGGWVSSRQKFYTHGEGFANFTHWMPLPTPPKQ